jgi:TPR repeat protein
MIKSIVIFIMLSGITLNAGGIDTLKKECESGNMKKCGELGFMYINGENVKRDPAKAGKYMTKACEGGEVNSCANIGNIMKSLYEAVCQGNQNKQCQQIAENVIKFFTKACDGGVADACRDLGLIYFDGKMLTQDINKATKYLLSACDSGNAISCYDFANMTKDTLEKAQRYTNVCKGEGQKQCQQLSNTIIVFMTKACDGGYAKSCSALGDSYAQGKGIEQNYFIAKDFYHKACDGGFALGCGALGAMYASGLGTKQNYSKSMELFKKSCDGGVAAACNTVADFYANGTGIKQNYSKAKEYYGKACDLKNNDGCKKYAEINQK